MDREPSESTGDISDFGVPLVCDGVGFSLSLSCDGPELLVGLVIPLPAALPGPLPAALPGPLPAPLPGPLPERPNSPDSFTADKRFDSSESLKLSLTKIN